MATRPGFIVQNAVNVSNLDQAEPDALDFNILGNNRHGVITGGEVTVTGSSYVMNVAPVIAVVDGQTVSAAGQKKLPTSSQSPRFDLITVTAAGGVDFIQGTADDNPVFPDYDDTVTVLAAVLVRPGITSPVQSDVTDKRVMLMERFMTAVKDGSILHNDDPVTMADLIDIDYNGKITWDGDGTSLSRVTAKTLHVADNLDVALVVTADDVVVNDDVTAGGDITGLNLRAGNGPPTGPARPGDTYRDTTGGAQWAYQNGSWAQLSTVPIPAGMVMPGFMTTPPPGWLLVNGQLVAKAVAGGLWDAMPSWQRTNNMVQLPDARDCFLAWGQPGVKGGNVSSQINLTTAQLPPHKHLDTPTTWGAGSHGHSATIGAAGAHSHTTIGGQGAHTHGIYDTGHVHIPPPGGGQFIVTMWGAHNKLDGLFNDASHTYSVEAVGNTDRNPTNISITSDNSPHAHTTDTQGQHGHSITIDAVNNSHTHGISEQSVGQGVPIDIRPPFMGMYLYVKT